MLNYLTGEGFGGNVSSGVESSQIACDWLVVNFLCYIDNVFILSTGQTRLFKFS